MPSRAAGAAASASAWPHSSQNFALGLAEARDLSDALQAFFQMRARYLQSVFDLNIAAWTLARAICAAMKVQGGIGVPR